MSNGMSNNKKKIILPIIILLLVIAIIGVTFAFFNYTRTGSANTLKTGRIYFSTEQTNNNTINLTNIFPMTKQEALADSSTNGTLVVTFTGDTTYTDGIEYLLSIDSVSRTANIPISLIMDVNVESRTAGDTPTTITLTENANYYTARNNKETSMYLASGEDTTINGTTHKVITDISNGKYLLTGYIKSGTDVVNGTVTIKAFIDTDNIIITDTPDDQSNAPSNYTDGTVTTGKTVISTTDWNSLKTNGVSFKVKGEANQGIWVSEPVLPSIYYWTYGENEIDDDVNYDTVSVKYTEENIDQIPKNYFIKTISTPTVALDDIYIIQYQEEDDDTIYFSDENYYSLSQCTQATETDYDMTINPTCVIKYESGETYNELEHQACIKINNDFICFSPTSDLNIWENYKNQLESKGLVCGYPTELSDNYMSSFTDDVNNAKMLVCTTNQNACTDNTRLCNDGWRQGDTYTQIYFINNSSILLTSPNYYSHDKCAVYSFGTGTGAWCQ